MLIAHLPAGYLLGRASGMRLRVMGAALLGSVLPDFDMLWFWFVDHGRVHHHVYWPHLPAFWLAVTLIALPAAWRFRPAALPVTGAFLAAIWLHLLLDTISGGILWAWPWSDHLYVLHEVQPTHDHWVKSFMADWTFGLEILIWVLAILALFRSRKSP